MQNTFHFYVGLADEIIVFPEPGPVVSDRAFMKLPKRLRWKDIVEIQGQIDQYGQICYVQLLYIVVGPIINQAVKTNIKPR